jgi:hypothetical protein
MKSTSPPPPPWIGPHALMPPPSLLSSSSSSSSSSSPQKQKHVRIIIRVHHQHPHLVQGLIHSLRDQQTNDFTLDIALVATELQGMSVAETIAKSFWLDPLDPFPHIYSVALTEDFFTQAHTNALSFKCTHEERQRWTWTYGKEAIHRVCDYTNHVYYQATDVALKEFVETCAWCTHLVVTNGDNAYHPDFFLHTLLREAPRFPLSSTSAVSSSYQKVILPALQRRPSFSKRLEKELDSKGDNENKAQEEKKKKKEEEKREAKMEEKGKKDTADQTYQPPQPQTQQQQQNTYEYDMVATDFTTTNKIIRAEFARGGVDLGSVLFSKNIIKEIGASYIGALPRRARAMEAHDADYWFVRKGMEVEGARVRVVHKLLFFHN